MVSPAARWSLKSPALHRLCVLGGGADPGCKRQRSDEKRRNDASGAYAPRENDVGRHGDTSGSGPCGTSPRTWCPAHPVRMFGSPPPVHPDRQRSRMTTADGRSPGSRVAVFRRLPGTRDPSGRLTEDSPLTVAGAAAALSHKLLALRSLLIPETGNRREHNKRELKQTSNHGLPAAMGLSFARRRRYFATVAASSAVRCSQRTRKRRLAFRHPSTYV